LVDVGLERCVELLGELGRDLGGSSVVVSRVVIMSFRARRRSGR